MVRVEIEPRFGWRVGASGQVRVWFKVNAPLADAEHLARNLDNQPEPTASLEARLRAEPQHFAIVATAPGWPLAAVDV